MFQARDGGDASATYLANGNKKRAKTFTFRGNRTLDLDFRTTHYCHDPWVFSANLIIKELDGDSRVEFFSDLALSN